jgi:hypothetical protein
MNDKKPQFDLLKEEYTALRAEICQSIGYQHRILLAGYGASGAFFGYIAAKTTAMWVPLIGIPFILLAMAALWLVECNRMVRASHYIGYYLWDNLKNSCPNCESLRSWETWIRDDIGRSREFCLRQSWAQWFVVFVIPFIISVGAGWVSTDAALALPGRIGAVFIGVLVIGAVLWGLAGYAMYGVSDLGRSRPEAEKESDKANHLKSES